MPAFTAVPTAAAVCATGAVPRFADVDPDTAAIDLDVRGRGRHRPHARGDPGAPLRASGADPGSRRAGARGRRPGARRRRPRVGLGRVCVQLLSHEEPRWGRRRWRGGHRRRCHSRRTCASCGRTGSPTATSTRASRRTRGSPRSRRRPCGWGSRASPRRMPVVARSRPATAPRRRTCGGNRRTTATSTTCVLLASRSATRFGARLPFETGVHYPRALTQQPAYSEFVAAPCPEAEAWAAECVSLPCFPEMSDDEIEAVCRALN